MRVHTCERCPWNFPDRKPPKEAAATARGKYLRISILLPNINQRVVGGKRGARKLSLANDS